MSTTVSKWKEHAFLPPDLHGGYTGESKSISFEALFEAGSLNGRRKTLLPGEVNNLYQT